MSASTKPKDPDVTELWQVSWWDRLPSGVLELRHDDHDTPGAARMQYMNQDAAAEPVLAKLSWDSETRHWHRTNLAYDDRSPGQCAEANRKGIAVIRSVIRHRRGIDSRGTILNRLDDALADDNPAVPTVKAEPAALVTEEPSMCIVCDYAMEHGLECVHTVVPLRPTQRPLHVPDEQF